ESLDLAQLRIKPNSVISYWLIVKDNKEPGSHRLETTHQVIEVIEPISPQEKQRFEEQQNKERERSEQSPQSNPEEVTPPPTGEHPPPPRDEPNRDANAQQSPADTRQNPSGGSKEHDRGTTTGSDNSEGTPGPSRADQAQPTPEQLRKLEEYFKEKQAQNRQ